MAINKYVVGLHSGDQSECPMVVASRKSCKGFLQPLPTTYHQYKSYLVDVK